MKKTGQLVVITGNKEDGFNVELSVEGHRIVAACEDLCDAQDLQNILNRCSWFEVHES